MLTFRYARPSDLDLLFEWANESVTRRNSYNTANIKYEDHVQWFDKRINSENFYCYIFIDHQQSNIGQVRIEKEEGVKEAVISISIDQIHRGKGYSSEMLRKASEDFLSKNNDYIIKAYIFKENQVSYKSFLNEGYSNLKEVVIKNIPSYILTYSNKDNEGH